MYVPGTPIVKRRRGRPRKVKAEDLSISNDETNLSFQTNELPQLLELTSDDIKEENENQPIHMEIIDDDKDDLENSPQRKRTNSGSKSIFIE